MLTFKLRRGRVELYSASRESTSEMMLSIGPLTHRSSITTRTDQKAAINPLAMWTWENVGSSPIHLLKSILLPFTLQQININTPIKIPTMFPQALWWLILQADRSFSTLDKAILTIWTILEGATLKDPFSCCRIERKITSLKWKNTMTTEDMVLDRATVSLTKPGPVKTTLLTSTLHQKPTRIIDSMPMLQTGEFNHDFFFVMRYNLSTVNISSKLR